METKKKTGLKELLNSDISILFKKNKNNEANKKTVKSEHSKPLTNKKFVAIDLGSQNIKVVEGLVTKDKVLVDKTFMFKSAIRAFNDTNLQNIEFVSKEIKDRIISSNIKSKNVNCTSNSTSIITREIVVPASDIESEVNTLVVFELQRYLPINLEDFIIQHYVLDSFQEENVEKLKIMAIIYPKTLAKNYVELAKSLSLNPNALDVNFNSIKKLITYKSIMSEGEYNPDNTVAIVDMGAETIQVNIYLGDKLEFTRIIKSGGSGIDSRIASELNVSMSEAEVMKKEDRHLLGEENNKVSAIIREEVAGWTSELGRVLQFYVNKQQSSKKIDCVYIYGGSSRINDIEPFMEEKLNFSVKKIKKLNNVDFDKNIEAGNEDCYLNAIGALIRF